MVQDRKQSTFHGPGAVIGFAIGVVAGVGATRVLAYLLFGVEGADVGTFLRAERLWLTR